MREEKFGANLPLFWNNDGKDRPKGQICPLAKKEVFVAAVQPRLLTELTTFTLPQFGGSKLL